MSKVFDERAHYEEKDQRDPQTRFWNTAFGRDARFEAILRAIPFETASIIDIGCGAGDLLAYAVANSATPREYLGLDLVPKFVEEASARGLPGRFEFCDILTDRWPVERANWVIANGLFGSAQPNDQWWPRFRAVTDLMWQHAEIGIAVTLVSTNSPRRNPDAHYADPATVWHDLLERLNWTVAMDQTYLPNDFLAVVRRNQRELPR